MDVAELRHTFAERIKELRTELGLNQGQFADFVGVSRGAMSYYEQEARTPDISVLRMICERCGVSADYMTGLIPDRDRDTADVCLETGLYPKAVRKLRLIQRIRAIEGDVAQEIICSPEWDDDSAEAVRLIPFTGATMMVNVLLANEEGLNILNLLSGIIVGAELDTGSDTQPKFKMLTGHGGIQIAYPLENINAALWVNIQKEVEKIKAKVDSADVLKPGEK